MAMQDHEHLACARGHRKYGETLLDTAVHEWGCVAIFYAVYHHAKWALLRDPRFNDFKQLKAIDPRLTREDRFANWHQARRGRNQSGFGINDLLGLLYPEVAAKYINLHQASLAVRYGGIERWGSLPGGEIILADADAIEKHLAQSVLG